MTRRSLRDLLRKKRADKKALSTEMRTLLDSFDADYGQRVGSATGPDSDSRESDTSPRR